MVKVMNLLTRSKQYGILTEKEVSDEKVYVILTRQKIDNIIGEDNVESACFVKLYCNMRYLRLIYNGFIRHKSSMWLMDGISGFMGYYSYYMNMLIKRIESNLDKQVLDSNLYLPEYDEFIEKMDIYMSRTLMKLDTSKYFGYLSQEKFNILNEILSEIKKQIQNSTSRIGNLKLNMLKLEYVLHILVLSATP